MASLRERLGGDDEWIEDPARAATGWRPDLHGVGVVGREHPVGATGRQLVGENRPRDPARIAFTPGDRRRRWSSFVADERPGEVELLPGALAFQALGAEVLLVLQHPGPHVVDTGVLEGGTGHHGWRPLLAADQPAAPRPGRVLRPGPCWRSRRPC